MKTAKIVDFRHAWYATVRMRRFYGRRFLHGTFPRSETRFPAKSTVNWAILASIAALLAPICPTIPPWY